MGLLEELNKRFTELSEKTDFIDDTEAAMDFEDLPDQDIDNDGDSDASDEYLHNRLGTIAKMNEAATDRFLQSAGWNLARQMRGKSASRTTLSNRLSRMPLGNMLKPDELEKIIDYAMKEMGLDEIAEANIPFISYNDFLANVKRYENGDIMKSQLISSFNRLKNSDQNKAKDILNSALDEIAEANVTANLDGGAGPMRTPRAFGRKEDERGSAEKLGMKKSKKTNKHFRKMESRLSYKTMMAEMYGVGEVNESVSYRDYKKDPKASPQQKVNKGIAEINTMLAEIERMVQNNVRLKQEMGVNSSHFWKATGKRFAKINERMTRISNRLRELSK